MSGWCPRCDAVREADGVCPECQAPMVDLDERPIRPAVHEDPAATEVGAVVEAPPRGRLRGALAVAAVVLVGLAFVAGRSTGGAVARTGPQSTSATTQTTAGLAIERPRALGWKSKPSSGIGVEAVSISRIGSDPVNDEVSSNENTGTLTLRVEGLDRGRRLLGITGLRLVDSGGGVFAAPDDRQIGGVAAVPVRVGGQAGSYQVNLGPTPSVDTLERIEFENLLVSPSASDRGRLELPTGGAWPSRPPLRAVEPAASSVTVPVARADGAGGNLPLRVASAFVGAGRAVIALSVDTDVASSRDLGVFPVSANVLAGSRLVCSRLTLIGSEGPQVSPLLVIDCPTSPTSKLMVELAAGVDTVRFGTRLVP
jgi:hypothetical protein